MANAKKLPSGNWRVQVYSHTDENGKRHYESFTGATKAEAEMKAAKFSNHKIRVGICDLTVREAIDRYITAKTNVLSPATIRAYRGMQKSHYAMIDDIKINKLTSENVQLFISQLSLQFSAKTVKNTFGLLSAALVFHSPDLTFKVTLPSAVKKTAETPSDEEVMELFKFASDWMKKCIALAAFGSLRRGEIAALKYSDIIGDSVYVHSDMVMDENNKWVHKPIPKNQSSVRYAKLPHEVIEMLGTGDPDTFIIGYNPNTISKMFIKLRNRIGSTIRFHDLRHYYASIGAVLGCPDFVIADFGGWRHDSPVLKNTYQGSISSIADGYSKKMNDHFSELMKKTE